MRSLLFVPADSPRKFAKAVASAADALILDLEDSVAPEAKAAARETLKATLAQAPVQRPRLFVRINDLESGLSLADLDAVMPARPDGIALPKCRSVEHLRQLGHYLDAFETVHGIATGTTKIMAIVTETADSLLALGDYRTAGPRLWGMAWGAEDLAASLGASANQAGGRWTDPYRLARNLCLIAAAAAGVVAVDTVNTDIDGDEGCRSEAEAARRDGFGAKMLIHPRHVAAVNQAFSPSDAEIAWARRIVAAFAADPAVGVVRLDGRMIDKPHLRAAEKILARLT